MTKPAYTAYVPVPPKKEGGKTEWLKIGPVWRNEKGLTLVVPQGMSVTGDIVMFPPKDNDAGPE